MTTPQTSILEPQREVGARYPEVGQHARDGISAAEKIGGILEAGDKPLISRLSDQHGNPVTLSGLRGAVGGC